MNETIPIQDQLQAQDVSNMWNILVLLAIILPIYYGFKKSKRQGVMNTGLVGAVLFLYIFIPAAREMILFLFIIIIIINLTIHIKEVVFS